MKLNVDDTRSIQHGNVGAGGIIRNLYGGFLGFLSTWAALAKSWKLNVGVSLLGLFKLVFRSLRCRWIFPVWCS